MLFLSPLEYFQVYPLISIYFLNYDYSITDKTLILCGILICLWIVLKHLNKLFSILSNTSLSFAESALFLTVDNINSCLLIGTFLILILVIVVVLIKKFESEVLAGCKSVQTFFDKNRLLVFGISACIVFLNSLLILPVCDSIIGVMIVFNMFLCLKFFDQEKIPFINIFVCLFGLYRFFSGQIHGWYICVLILVFYIWGVVSIVFGVPDVEQSLHRLREAQEPTVYHLKKELYYYMITDQVILVFLISKFGFNFFPTLLGNQLIFILDIFMYQCMGMCIIVKLISIWVFNPGTGTGMKVVNTCVGCGGLFVAGAGVGLEAHKQATTGNGIEPPNNWLTKAIQKNRWGVTASTAVAVDSVKIWEQVYRTLPPKIPGTDEVDTLRSIQTFKNEKNPDLRMLIEHLDPKYKK